MLSSTRPRRFSKDETVRILNGMDIKLPADTKLDGTKLQHRLRKALDAAQRFYTIFPHNDVNPLYYPKWPSNRRLAPIFQRNQDGASWGPDSKKMTSAEMPDIEKNTTHEVAFRELVAHIDDISEDWDLEEGFLSLMLRDDDTKRTVLLRIFSVHEITPTTPLIFLGYIVIDGLEKSSYDRVLADYLKPGEGMEIYYMNALEQDLFMHLLMVNRRHISPAFQPTWNAKLQHFRLSFFIPIAKVSKDDVTRLSSNTGCLVCGKTTEGICKGCEEAQYCSEKCQRKHWKVHKETCGLDVSS